MKLRKSLGVLAVAVALPLTLAGNAYADIPFNQTKNGPATRYNNKGNGACGAPIDAANQVLVAAPAPYWTTANPNNDPLCKGVSIQVTYKGKTITVPVKDKCPSCDANHIDLSDPAFRQLENPDAGVIQVSWKFVRS